MPFSWFSFGVYDENIGGGAVGDPHFGSVKDVPVSFFLSSELHADHITSSTWLGHSEGSHVLSTDKFGEIFLFLFFSSIESDLIDTKI